MREAPFGRNKSEIMINFAPVFVFIKAEPEKVWEFVADLNNWKQFGGFGENPEQLNENEWVAHTLQGDIKVIPKFDKEKLLLDHICIISSGEEQFVSYRVTPVQGGSELMMSNPQTTSVSDEDYRNQLKRMNEELNNIKKILEARDISTE